MQTDVRVTGTTLGMCVRQGRGAHLCSVWLREKQRGSWARCDGIHPVLPGWWWFRTTVVPVPVHRLCSETLLLSKGGRILPSQKEFNSVSPRESFYWWWSVGTCNENQPPRRIARLRSTVWHSVLWRLPRDRRHRRWAGARPASRRGGGERGIMMILKRWAYVW